MSKPKSSRILETVRDTARDLAGAGVMDDVTMREFDALCLPPVKPMSAHEIKKIRLGQRVSQPVFAAHLNVTKSTVAQWEQGDKKPRGSSLKLLEIVKRKGLAALT
jgi:putative transcriptional regulator